MYKILIFIFLANILLTGCSQESNENSVQYKYLTAEDSIKAIPAQLQLIAYNNRNIYEFEKYFSEDIKLIRLPSGEEFVSSKEEFIKIYSELFASKPLLNCQVINRIVCGNYVFDEELVTGLVEGKEVHATAIYEIFDGLIHRVWFVRKD